MLLALNWFNAFCVQLKANSLTFAYSYPCLAVFSLRKFDNLQLQEELELLKAKLEKLESERVSLKHHNDKLEAKVGFFC